MGDFQGRTVVVTGGTKGVGRGIAQAFVDAPDTLPSGAGTCQFTAADVRDHEQVDAVIQFAVEQHNGVDVLINNAGGTPFALAAGTSPRFAEKIIALNLLGPLYFSQAANRIMQEQDTGGAIVNIASVSATRPSPGTAAYGAAKAGLLNLTQSLAVEWAPKVRVNAVTAGMILTEQAHLHYGDEAGIAAVAKTVPAGRLATPNDIAQACLFLASDKADYVSGASLLVHGGGERPSFLDAANAESAQKT